LLEVLRIAEDIDGDERVIDDGIVCTRHFGSSE